jgi:predicted metal-binding membrane protein
VPTLLRSFLQPPWPLLFGLAGLGLAASALQDGDATLAAFCARTGVPVGAWPDALGALFVTRPPAELLGAWALMLLAMMPPLLTVPLAHVWRSSLPRRRPAALASFAVGYGAVWLAVGPVLVGFALMAELAAGPRALLVALLIAGVWSASPWQRMALNRSHRLPRIGLFGWGSLGDACAFGALHARWCVVSCWAWMLVPLAAGRWHVLAMVLAGAVMLVERLARPDRPRWRLPELVASALSLRWSLAR